jgi:lipopolysaccharide/colanic/teichoic acid biosynthesis glycosyltransferase
MSWCYSCPGRNRHGGASARFASRAARRAYAASCRDYSESRGKRALDVILAAVGLALLWPLMLVAVLAVKLEDGGPAFHSQRRLGRFGRPFTMYKLRSMRPDAERRLGELLPLNEAGGTIFKMRRDPRVSRIGRLLRRFSIDELPQLVNVLAGDMSMVGPRPPRPAETGGYRARDFTRLSVRPGLTCLWQVRGRSLLPFRRQVELDLEYIQGRRPALDLAIILMTLPAVVTGKGAY